jgi:hypothetical protein
MKITETRLKQIIQEEMDRHNAHMDDIDEEGEMAKAQLYKIAKYSMMLHDALDDETQLESWVQSKITIASEYMSKVTHYLEYEMGLDLQDPDLDMESEDVTPCGEAEPLMVVGGEAVYDIDDEDEYLMEN